jgi:hypothetical protein
MFKNRSTIDVVVILLTITIGGAIVLSIIGVLILKLRDPAMDVKGASSVVGNILTTVVGALVGFIGGRATGRMEESKANGQQKIT